MGIRKALQGMKGWQMKVYNKLSNSELKNAKEDSHKSLYLLVSDVMNFVRNIDYPSSLDFLDDPQHKLLPATMRNKLFINQLRELEWFQDELNKIPLHDNLGLQSRHKEISETVG
ncbi:hypothetical protein OPQ81_002665 [Rhizoctonia solani]|nr:hypothetical protein OPQ81_002665 [Rhizoctonia solani]